MDEFGNEGYQAVPKDPVMEPACEEHLLRVKREFCRMVDRKYRDGQAEHGGHLWLKGGIEYKILEEALDMVVYALTLIEQKEARGG